MGFASSTMKARLDGGGEGGTGGPNIYSRGVAPILALFWTILIGSPGILAEN